MSESVSASDVAGSLYVHRDIAPRDHQITAFEEFLHHLVDGMGNTKISQDQIEAAIGKMEFETSRVIIRLCLEDAA